MALFWHLFIQNLMVNRTRISTWCTDEEKVVKIVISIEMVKSSKNPEYIKNKKFRTIKFRTLIFGQKIRNFGQFRTSSELWKTFLTVNFVV